jgi:glucosamine-6-phosphate deaminase
MKLIKVKNYEELSKKAAEIVIKEINKKPDIVLGFATGKTPIGLYKNLVKAYDKKKVDFSFIKSFNLDEYYPINKKDKQSYFYYLHKNLFDKLNIKRENINLLNGEAKNPGIECWDYENKIKENPIDLQILGVGINGHIGFNEPGSKIDSITRVVELTSETKKINKTNKKAMTIGISTLLRAKKIILLASGKNKAKAVYYLINGKEDKEWPVSYLRKHKNLIVIIDKPAGKLL